MTPTHLTIGEHHFLVSSRERPPMLRKRGRFWHVQLKINGIKKTRSTGEVDYRRAKAKEPQIVAQANLRRRLSPESLRWSVVSANEILRIDADISEREADRAGDSFTKFREWLGRDIEIDQITASMIEDYQRFRLRSKAISTVNRDLGYILRLLKNNGFVVEKPSAKRGTKTKVREFTDDELVRFFSHCQRDQQTLFLFLLATGARPAEVIPSHRSNHVAILKSEVLPEENAVIVRPAKVRQGSDHDIPRKLLIPEELMERVVELAKRTKGQHVFSMRHSSLKNLFSRIIDRAGIDRVDALGRKLTAHSFRHTYATRLAKITQGNQFVLKSTLGHAQISTTDRYVHAEGYASTLDIEGLLASEGWQKGVAEHKKTADESAA